MKKFLSLFLVLCLAISSLSTLVACGKNKDDDDDTPDHVHSYVDGTCDCGATDPNYTPSNPSDPGSNPSDPGSNPSDPGSGATTEVTDAQWAAAFTFGTNYVFDAKMVFGADEEESLAITRAGYLFKTVETETFDNENWVDTYYYDLTPGAEKEYEPEYNSDDELLFYMINVMEDVNTEMLESYFFGEIIPEDFMDKDLYTYNATSKKYELTAPVEVYGATVSTVKVTFANAKITNIYYEVGNESFSTNCTVNISYGNASVILPTNVFDATADMGGGITAEEFENALTFFGNNYTIEQKVIYDANNYEIYEFKRAGSLFSEWDTEFEGGVETEDNMPNYYEFVGENCYAYHYTGSGYYKSNYGNDDPDKFHADLVYENLGLNGYMSKPFNYTYDATEGVFVIDNYTTTYGYDGEDYGYSSIISYEDVKIKFNSDGKVEKITYNLSSEYTSWEGDKANAVTELEAATMDVSFVYGNATITLPTNVTDPSDQMYMVQDESSWKSSLNCQYEMAYKFISTGISDGQVSSYNSIMTYYEGIIHIESCENGVPYDNEYYAWVDGDYYYYYVDNGVWARQIVDEDAYNYQLPNAFMDMFEYSNFEFDSETKTYQLVEPFYFEGSTVAAATIEFFEGKLVGLNMLNEFMVGSEKHTAQTIMELEYEDIYLELPTVGSTADTGNGATAPSINDGLEGEEVADSDAWAAALDFSDKNSYLVETVFTSMDGVVIDNNSVMGYYDGIIYMTASDGEGHTVGQYYYINDNGTYYQYSNDEETGYAWVVEEISEEEYNYTLPGTMFSLFSYDNFAYDADSKTYKQIEDMDMGVFAFKDCEIKIVDGKIASMIIGQYAGSMMGYQVLEFSYDFTTSLPTIG